MSFQKLILECKLVANIAWIPEQPPCIIVKKSSYIHIEDYVLTKDLKISLSSSWPKGKRQAKLKNGEFLFFINKSIYLLEILKSYKIVHKCGFKALQIHTYIPYFQEISVFILTQNYEDRVNYIFEKNEWKFSLCYILAHNGVNVGHYVSVKMLSTFWI